MNRHPAFRKGTWDEAIYNQVYLYNEYGLPPTLPPNTVVIDIGAHIGSFSMLAIDRGAISVAAYEANTENYLLAAHNTQDFKIGSRVRVREQAVWHERGFRSFWPSTLEENTGGGNVWTPPAEGGFNKVECVTLNDAIADAMYRAPVKDNCHMIVKLDCEGSEFPILLSSVNKPLLTLHVNELMGEYHNFDKVPDEFAGWGMPFTIAHLDDYLKQLGYEGWYKPSAENLGHFHYVRTK